MKGCVFCKIVSGEIPTRRVYENDDVLVFPDIYPVAPVHRNLHIDRSGFRLILNTNADGGQEVFHAHMHMLGGEPIGRLRCRH
ncbi:MAG: HIT domain-containing protein [Candidatus Latescibacter sp.]|nr:HIT domain-containing protein [Candidatus Latescibacter sp.]